MRRIIMKVAGRVFAPILLIAAALPSSGTPKTALKGLRATNVVIDLTSASSFRASKKLTFSNQGVGLRANAVMGDGESKVIASLHEFRALAVKWAALAPAPDSISIQVRVSPDGIGWENWSVVHRNADFEDSDTSACLLLLNSNYRFVQFRVLLKAGDNSDSPILRMLLFQFIDPGYSRKAPGLAAIITPKAGTSMPPKPPIISRIDWQCPDGEDAPLWAPEYTSVTHLIVHHTDTSNSSPDWAGDVRAIWYYHTYGNGWGDIGYNYLIDPNGTIYEGRAGGDDVKGAHFSCANSYTMGVGLLGDFTSILPTTAALSSLEALLAWKAAQRGIDPEGSSYHAASQLTLNNISGHRDGNPMPVGCPSGTVCPGDAFYPMLPAIRSGVAQIIAGSNELPVATLTAPSAGAVLAFPQTFSWSLSSNPSVNVSTTSVVPLVKVYFAATSAPLVDEIAFSHQTVVGGGQVTVTAEQWALARGILGPSSTYYWTLGNANELSPVAYARWRPFGFRTLRAAGDFDADSKADILWQNVAGHCSALLMNGTTASRSVSVANAGTSWNIVGAVDFDRDGKTDILWQDTSNKCLVWFMNGTVRRQFANIGTAAAGWTIVGAGDFDRDGNTDILWQKTSGECAIWLMNGTTRRQSIGLHGVAPGWRIVGASDFDRDGNTDILWQKTSGECAIWLMNGTTRRQSVALRTPTAGWSIVGVADFDGDHKIDILWQRTSGEAAIWYMNGTSFRSAVGLGVVGP